MWDQDAVGFDAVCCVDSVMGWIVSGIGRMLPQPVPKQVSRSFASWSHAWVSAFECFHLFLPRRTATATRCRKVSAAFAPLTAHTQISLSPTPLPASFTELGLSQKPNWNRLFVFPLPKNRLLVRKTSSKIATFPSWSKNLLQLSAGGGIIVTKTNTTKTPEVVTWNPNPKSIWC